MNGNSQDKVIPASAFVMIVGAMKSGTSSLFELLRQPPQICAASEKEPEFFSRNQAHVVSKKSRYEDYYDFDVSRHRFCLEASTGYTKFPHEQGVAERIRDYGLQPRCIYIVRDPVDRIVSQLNYAVVNNHDWIHEPLAGFHAVALSMYHTQMKQFLAAFPDSGRYLIVDFGKLKSDPVGLVSSIFQWLGLEEQPVHVGEPVNVTPARSVVELQLTRSPLHKLRLLLPPQLRSMLKTFLRSRDRPADQKLGAWDQQLLHEWLADDMARFRETFNFPVEQWGFAGEIENVRPAETLT